MRSLCDIEIVLDVDSDYFLKEVGNKMSLIIQKGVLLFQYYNFIILLAGLCFLLPNVHKRRVFQVHEAIFKNVPASSPVTWTV